MKFENVIRNVMANEEEQFQIVSTFQLIKNIHNHKVVRFLNKYPVNL